MKLNKFVFSVFLLLFNHFVVISTSTSFADHGNYKDLKFKTLMISWSQTLEGHFVWTKNNQTN